MNSALFLQIVTIAADAFIFIFVGFYLWSLVRDKKILEEKEKELEGKKTKLEADYQQMATQMQIKEKEMLDNASIQANSIIANAQNISSTSKNTVEGALQQMAINLEQNAAKSTSDYLTNYKNFLNQISQKSLEDFQGLAKNFEGDMDAKMKEFRDSLLPALQKELEAYKNKRFIEADKNVNEIVQKVAQKVLNKAISMEDHKNLIIESLEKARRENIFD